jgi:hypothetical protein
MPDKKPLLITDIYSPKEQLASEKKTIKNKPNFSFKKGLIFVFVFLSLLGFFFFFDLAKAEIEIKPKIDFIESQGEVNVPIKFFQKEKTVLEVFQSSGKIMDEGKAEGTIKVYNEYSTSPQVLIATTRFVSADGKLFRTPEAVTIPGGRYEGGKFIPGEIDIRVVADQSGEDYNISPSVFSVPGFAGTDRYTKFYGKSFEPMQGGFKKEVAKVTEEDLIEAENLMVEQVIKECLDLLEEDIKSESISAEYDCISDEFDSQIIEKNPLVLAGEEKEEFSFQVKASCQALLVKKEIVTELAKGLIIKEQSENNSDNYNEVSFIFVPDKISIIEDSLKINYSVESIDIDLAEVALSLKTSSKFYPEIDFYNLKNALLGRNSVEAEMFLENQSEIVNADVFLSPFWVKKIPQDLNQIEVSINVD